MLVYCVIEGDGLVYYYVGGVVVVFYVEVLYGDVCVIVVNDFGGVFIWCVLFLVIGDIGIIGICVVFFIDGKIDYYCVFVDLVDIVFGFWCNEIVFDKGVFGDQEFVVNCGIGIIV